MSAVPDEECLARILQAARSSPASLLGTLDSPEDLRRLAPHELATVAQELRQYLVQSVADNGGHLSAGLGTVELTLALHYVFNTPRDALVWDVGHQCYPHKILTGRRDRLPSIRRRGGLSGFLRRDESPYDSFGAGHSSTSISAALGMAIANAHQGMEHKSVAIIGDGGMTAGLAFEALDHAGALDADLMVVLNDNRMSISPNVGALSNYLTRILANRNAGTGRPGGRRLPGDLPANWERARRRAKGIDVPGQWFEELGFAYFGPVDGHDLPALLRVMRHVRELKVPRILHVVTNKGHGYAPAAADPVKYHGVTPFDPEVGIVSPSKTSSLTYTQIFGTWLCDMAARDSRLVAITPAMREGSGLVGFAAQFPQRYFDVGIAEQHSVTLAAGLACQGLKPVVAIYSTFLQRAYDQLIHDVAIQKLPVLFAIDRAGLVGPDGATHTGGLDLTYLRCVPGLTVMTPADGQELRNMLYTGYRQAGPVAVRYPRANITTEPPTGEMELVPVGVAQIRRRGAKVALLVFGTLLDTALKVAEKIGATVVNMRFVKPLDAQTVVAMASTHELIVTVEENAIAGGAGSSVNECIARHGMAVGILNLGLPDENPEHGTREDALRDAGLDCEGILGAINARLALKDAMRAASR